MIDDIEIEPDFPSMIKLVHVLAMKEQENYDGF